MTDPKRWIDDGAPDEVREVLIAASAEQPGHRSAERALVALGVAGTPAAAAAAAKGAASTAALAKSSVTSGSIAIALKWGLVGAASAVATAGAVAVLRQPAAHSDATAAARLESPSSFAATAPSSAAAAPSEAAPVAAEDVEHEIASHPAVPQKKIAPSTSAIGAAQVEPVSTMREEVAQIDLARAALARGDAPAAIAALDSYASRFELRHFEPEALYLRMEALGRSGDLDGQRRIAERLLAAFPAAPQSARARAVLR